MTRREGSVDQNTDQSTEQSTDQRQSEASRREIRAGYHAIHNRINVGRDEIASADSPMFKTILEDVEKLHQQVVKPREQVADAQVMLNLTTTLLTSTESLSLGAFTPANFVSSLKRQFVEDSQRIQSGNSSNSISWKAIGRAAAHVFKQGIGCRTMIGPTELMFKQQKCTVVRRHRRLIQKEKPKEVNSEEETHNDMIVAVMFGVLKKNNPVKLENLILNRHSFAQTVENLFALSFLVRDGRVFMEVDENGSHLLSPRNAPIRRLVVRGEVKYSHFIFRLDFADWKLMMDSVPRGEELMPNRKYVDDPADEELEEELETKNVQLLLDTPPPPGVSQEEGELKEFEMAESSRKRPQLLPEMTETGRASNPTCRRKLF
ncbi:non-structural maintenance of chromosomes element 4 homolog A-like [Coffea eugenioides]|uniref:non-structural maintenance of chromosomes element 4 homolog A-like n=1 Tax=Coffea eugenioides TaxID=49369 RepID=UPI000F609B30|nr:non-structural maintenance of chromosomes element 4 homolog A-like [Coffea eugenioides]